VYNISIAGHGRALKQSQYTVSLAVILATHRALLTLTAVILDSPIGSLYANVANHFHSIDVRRAKALQDRRKATSRLILDRNTCLSKHPSILRQEHRYWLHESTLSLSPVLPLSGKRGSVRLVERTSTGSACSTGLVEWPTNVKFALLHLAGVQ
jgi:hypothetical protein